MQYGLKKSVFNWSGGKDSSLALYHIMKDDHWDVQCLLTTVNAHYDRITMHGVRKELLISQAKAIGLPLEMVALPKDPSMSTYEEILEGHLIKLKDNGVDHSIFGDIFLADLKKYREEKLHSIGMTAHFPLWDRNTKTLLKEFLHLGFKTIIVCVNGSYLDKSFAGKVIDATFIDDLPENVDPCGENGEFHTFVFDGPIFSEPVPFEIGQVISRSYPNPDKPSEMVNYWFCDLLPVSIITE